VAAARGREPSLRRAIRAAVRAGVRPARLDEALLQLIPFTGYARAINAFAVLQEVVPHPARSLRGKGGLRRRGKALCRRIYGPVYRKMIARMRGFHPDLADWILEDGYGRVLARPGLSILERELLVVAVLGTLNVPAQLKSHQLGAQRVGAVPAQLAAMLRLSRGRS
jgi:4-carboxymuconolactone decarboxylase